MHVVWRGIVAMRVASMLDRSFRFKYPEKEQADMYIYFPDTAVG